MSSLSTLPKGDSAWLLRKSIQRIMQQVSVLETNIGSSTTGNSANTQVIFNDAGTLRGDAGLTYNKATDTLSTGSATITGDLTVDTSTLKVDSTNNRVGIGTATPIAGSRLDVRSAIGTGTDIQSLAVIDTSPLAINNGGGISFGYVFEAPSTVIGRAGYIKTIKENATDGNYASAMVFGVTANGASTAERYRIGSDGTSTWYVGGSEAMRLNSTGLGVGVVPGSAIGNLQVGGSANGNLYTQQGTDTVRMGMRATGRTGILFDSSDATYTNRAWYLDNVGSTGSLIIGRQGLDVVTFSNSGNVGIGVTPSAQLASYKSFQFGIGGNLIGRTDNAGIELSSNAYRSGSGSYIYLNTTTAASYRQYSGTHQWFTAASGTAGNTISFTQAMTLDASGNLLVGTVTAPAGTKVGSIAKLSGVSVEGTAAINVSTTPVAIAKSLGTGGLFFVTGYNTSGGTQCWFLVASKQDATGTPTVIASENSTGLTVTFTNDLGVIKMNTNSGTIQVNSFAVTN
jgi:hypothetical protein